MNKIIELTIKLKELGVVVASWTSTEDVSWTIESVLAWLREKGWAYSVVYYNDHDNHEVDIWVIHPGKNPPYKSVVKPGHELEGLLECMVKIEEGG